MAFRPRELGCGDLDAIVELHETVHTDHVATGVEVDHGLFARETRAFFHDHLEVRGRIFGIHDAGRLIAYGVLGLPAPGDDHFGALVDHPPTDPGRVAHVDGVAVRPAHRGQRLQRLLIEHRLQAALERGRDLVYTTVSPRNLHSLGNLQQAGFRIVGRRALFGGHDGGHDRFVMEWAGRRADAEAQVVADLAAGTL